MENKKNIWVIPTDNPSRLFLNKLNNKILLEDIVNPSLKNVLPSGSYQHIYITSDSEFKEGDWFITKEGILHNNFGWNYGDKKIILTTDEKLINDGVQAIDDEFLEWFVKNPSCEKIEVVLDVIKHIPWDKELESKYDFEKGYPITDYRITIPKEESKQTDEKGNPLTFWGGLAEPKEETLEEASELAWVDYQYSLGNNLYETVFKDGFKLGNEHQAKKMHSNEELRDIISKILYKLQFYSSDNLKDQIVDELFNQFKKK